MGPEYFTAISPSETTNIFYSGVRLSHHPTFKFYSNRRAISRPVDAKPPQPLSCLHPLKPE